MDAQDPVAAEDEERPGRTARPPRADGCGASQAHCHAPDKRKTWSEIVDAKTATLECWYDHCVTHPDDIATIRQELGWRRSATHMGDRLLPVVATLLAASSLAAAMRLGGDSGVQWLSVGGFICTVVVLCVLIRAIWRQQQWTG